MSLKKIILAFLLLSSIANSSYAQWQQCVGTTGLNIQAVMTDGIYNFAGGATGVYLSTDTAANYTFSNTGNDSLGPTRGFTKDNNYTYTCTSQGVYRSANNGTTWVHKSSGLTNLLTGGIISVGSYLFVVVPTGVFKSSNQGDNWTTAGLVGTDVRCITAIQDTLYAGTNGNGIYKSTDWGANWVAINTGLGSANNFRAIEAKGNTLFTGGQTASGVFRSTNFGATWTMMSGLPTGAYRGFASNSQIIVTGSFGGGVHYSTNNGDNWTAINTGLTNLEIFDLELNDAYIVAATNTQGVFRFALSNIFSNIQSIFDNIEIDIFPNPTTNQVYIKTDASLIGTIYTLFDNTGKFISSGRINSETTKLDLSNLSGGIYLLNLGENIKKTFKVLKK